MTSKFLLTTCALLASVGTAMAETQPLTERLLKESEKTAAEKAVTKNDAGRVMDRDAGKVKHCYENDRRWRSIFQSEK